jgi:hypothetical protein
VDPVPDPLLLRKSGSTVNRTQDLWICSQKCDHYTTEAVTHNSKQKINTKINEIKLKIKMKFKLKATNPITD